MGLCPFARIQAAFAIGVIMEKQCSKCKERKALSEFHIDKKNKDGLHCWCKVCRSACSKKYYEEKEEKLRINTRIYYKKHSKESNARNRDYYRRTQKDRLDYRKKYYKKHLKKEVANHIVSRAIESGILIRPNKCSKCNCECKPDGHHEDYDKPLEVIWLCKSCHKKHHSAFFL